MAPIRQFTFFTWKHLLLVAILFFGLGFGVRNFENNQSLALAGCLRIDDHSYSLINPLLLCNISENKVFSEFTSLKNKIGALLNDEKQKGNLSSASVYYREPKTGKWLGINENATYNPGSMLKIAIMIAYFKEEEINPGTLSQTATYTPTLHRELTQIPFETNTSLVIGVTYTIDNLIKKMIIDSDNGAKDLLLSNINENYLNEVYSDLGIQNPVNSPDYVISAKTYALFFRVLYNATYLSREKSEKALKLLTQTTFTEGLAEPIPPTVLIAHKFGEHVSLNQNNPIVELHDCGLVYIPENPYLICVMTEGKDAGALSQVIRKVSETIYKEKEISK